MEKILNCTWAAIWGAIIGFFSPIQGDMLILMSLFVGNFLFGMIADTVINGNDFSFKKASQCFIHALVFFALICFIFIVFFLKNQIEFAVKITSTLTWIAIFIYLLNILRNLKIALPHDSSMYKIIALVYQILTAEFLRRFPELKDRNLIKMSVIIVFCSFFASGCKISETVSMQDYTDEIITELKAIEKNNLQKLTGKNISSHVSEYQY